MPTKIEWCDETWNPITGCTPISEGCENCYAKRMALRLAGRWGYSREDPFRVTFHRHRLRIPQKVWKKSRRIFVCSMGDLWHPDVRLEHRAAVVRVMEDCPQHRFMCLTKRPERVSHDWRWVRSDASSTCAWPGNVWLGTTVENQRRADERIPHLLQVKAAVRFLSCEPLLGELNLNGYLPGTWSCVGCGYVGENTGEARYCQKCGEQVHGAVCLCGEDAYEASCPRCGEADGFGEYGCEGVHATPPVIDWLIIGPETGQGRRPCKQEWVESLIGQADTAGIPVFNKAMEIDGRVSKDPAEWSEWARRQEFPAGM